MDIRPASALRTEYNEMALRSRETGQPVYITKNGEGDTVLMDIGAYTRREDDLRHREAIVQHRSMVLDAEINRLNGASTYSSADIRALVRERISAGEQEAKHV